MSTVTRFPQPTDTKGRLSAEIRSRLGRYDLNQTDLAAAMGLTQSQISKRLRGVIAFNVDELEQVAAFLETTVVELLGGIPPQGPNGGQPGSARDVVTREYSPLRLVA